ncbi:MAG TPA: hypothetical protein VGX28_00435 [Frankiaceae bacterium]|jgi:hypothetical protein|nr:hypothetical protein [Frankiaceae bacterium]
MPYDGLRRLVLGLDPREAGLPERSWAYGALLETTDEDGSGYTLVCLADGTTSLYTSTGGGVIGAGEHEAVAAATLRFLDVVEGAPALFEPDPDDGRPRPGDAVLRALAYSGRLRAGGAERELAEGRHPVSPLFFAAHDVIAQVRRATP